MYPLGLERGCLRPKTTLFPVQKSGSSDKVDDKAHPIPSYHGRSSMRPQPGSDLLSSSEETWSNANKFGYKLGSSHGTYRRGTISRSTLKLSHPLQRWGCGCGALRHTTIGVCEGTRQRSFPRTSRGWVLECLFPRTIYGNGAARPCWEREVTGKTCSDGAHIARVRPTL